MYGDQRRPVLEDCVASIDVREWRRDGKLLPGNSFKVERHSGGSLSSVLGVAVREYELVLLFKRMDGLYSKLPISEEAVDLIVDPNPVHPLVRLACPCCRRRVYRLFVAPDAVRFVCARCTGLRRAIDFVSRNERLALQLARVSQKLGGPPAWALAAQIRKPRNMHHATFNALLAKRATLQAALTRSKEDKPAISYNINLGE